MQSLLFFEGTGDLVGSAKEVKVLAYTATVTERVVVEGIASLIKLVGQIVVGIVEVEAEADSVMKSGNGNLVTWTHTSPWSALSRLAKAKASCWPAKKPRPASLSCLSRGRLVSKPKKDIVNSERRARVVRMQSTEDCAGRS